jgi:hypothetical protein
MTVSIEKIESSDWAQRLKVEAPWCYKDAIKLAIELEWVTLEKRDDHSAKNDFVWAIIPDCSEEFWLDGLPTKEAALEVCRQMSWPVREDH